MRYLTILISALFFSCSEKPKKETTDFNEKIVEFAIENTDNKFIGYEIKDWERGNHPLGARIITMKLRKGNSECEVLKIYYSTDNLPKEIYKTTESIRCKKSSQ